MDFSEFVGLEYSERGQGPESYDCWGLFRAAFERGTGLTLAAFDPYSSPVELSGAAGVRGAGTTLAWTVLQPPAALRAYDGVVMLIRGRYHVGLMVDAQRMLHIQRRRTSVIESVSRYAPVIECYMRHERLV